MRRNVNVRSSPGVPRLSNRRSTRSYIAHTETRHGGQGSSLRARPAGLSRVASPAFLPGRLEATARVRFQGRDLRVGPERWSGACSAAHFCRCPAPTRCPGRKRIAPASPRQAGCASRRRALPLGMLADGRPSLASAVHMPGKSQPSVGNAGAYIPRTAAVTPPSAVGQAGLRLSCQQCWRCSWPGLGPVLARAWPGLGAALVRSWPGLSPVLRGACRGAGGDACRRCRRRLPQTPHAQPDAPSLAG